MAYIIRLHPKADEEYIAAYTWYEEQQAGLGERFIKAVRERMESIANNPETFGSKDNIHFREALIEAFPYIIVYKVYKQKNEIFMSAIYHAKRHPKKKYRK